MRNARYWRGAYWLGLGAAIVVAAAIHMALGAALLAIVALAAGDNTTRRR